MAVDRPRKLELDRSLDDECRALRHAACGHIGAGGGLRTDFVFACTCGCHEACPALEAPLAAMADACTCRETRDVRAALAERLGIKYRKKWEIRRGSADSPEGESVTSVSFLIAVAGVLVLFFGGIGTAKRARGSIRTLGIIVAAVTGAYLGWISVLVVLMRLIVRSASGSSRKREHQKL